MNHYQHPVQATLCEARMAQGRKIRELAESVRGFVSVQDITSWETGTKVPSLHKLAAWADALGYDIVAVPREVSPAGT